MTSNFDLWEKDPFFPAAEEVQDSADRMESVYRKWIHDKKDGDSEEIRTELHTALGTAKWQLEDFQKAVESCSAKDARVRHQQFVVAIDNQISRTENSLRDLNGNTEMAWVNLNEGERDELAQFLTGSSPYGSSRKDEEGSSRQSLTGTNADSGKNSFHSVDLSPREAREERNGTREERNVTREEKNGTREERNGSREERNGHRRTLSASADCGGWKIAIADAEQPHLPPPRVPSLSSLMRTVESSSKLKWAKNGFRKWKGSDRLQAADSELLQPHQPSVDINACCERGKSCCLDSYDDESYNKQLHGWLGSFQRQIQRSQYQIQYSRQAQMTFWTVLIVLFMVLFVLRAICSS
ncbi:hypothetical protein H6P81_020388 [Aristolochia fimbriata]|uniref:Syntaxin 6/10/61 N-terminal domain-containing protein n=1 Tax=Aristolochia fimbriata TaxID=158543 RepID=A0AAV7DYP9_ARIFI|nr:hypothetical protein H6P81_020388 [Aristolochia fimbriata]